jgi:hypothetical protein
LAFDHSHPGGGWDIHHNAMTTAWPCSRRCAGGCAQGGAPLLSSDFIMWRCVLVPVPLTATCRIFQRKLKLSSVCFLRHRDLILCSEKYPDMVKWGVFSQNGSYTAKKKAKKRKDASDVLEYFQYL